MAPRALADARRADLVPARPLARRGLGHRRRARRAEAVPTTRCAARSRRSPSRSATRASTASRACVQRRCARSDGRDRARAVSQRRGRSDQGGAADRRLPAHGGVEIPATALLEGFYDLSFAYRFGPPTADLVHARLRDGERVVERCVLVSGRLAIARASSMSGSPRCVAGATRTTASSRFRRAASRRPSSIEAPGFVADDNGFHLAPGQRRRIVLRASPSGRRVYARYGVSALNAERSARFELVSAARRRSSPNAAEAWLFRTRRNAPRFGWLHRPCGERARRRRHRAAVRLRSGLRSAHRCGISPKTASAPD